MACLFFILAMLKEEVDKNTYQNELGYFLLFLQCTRKINSILI